METKDRPASVLIDTEERLVFSRAGDTSSALVHWFADTLAATMTARGHVQRTPDATPTSDAELPEHIRLVINMTDLERPRPVRRSGQGTFVATVCAGYDEHIDPMKAAYPALVRSLSNMVIYLIEVAGALEAHFITIEQGHYTVRHTGNDGAFFSQVFSRIQPLACSHLVINNRFVADLPAAFWGGDEPIRQISWAGKELDKMGLLPAAIRIEDFLSERDLRHVKRLYSIGGLSYGNLSARALHNPRHFWMSASGVDKSKLETVGRDILLVTGYEPDQLQMTLSVPPDIEPRRVSVDAIEHYMMYREHPQVGAIVHIHAWWRDPIASTEVNYPCGTYELASEVAELVRQSPDPSRAVIGLKNHGLTITGHSIAEIFARIDGMIVPQVPMS